MHGRGIVLRPRGTRDGRKELLRVARNHAAFPDRFSFALFLCESQELRSMHPSVVHTRSLLPFPPRQLFSSAPSQCRVSIRARSSSSNMVGYSTQSTPMPDGARSARERWAGRKTFLLASPLWVDDVTVYALHTGG